MSVSFNKNTITKSNIVSTVIFSTVIVMGTNVPITASAAEKVNIIDHVKRTPKDIKNSTRGIFDKLDDLSKHPNSIFNGDSFSEWRTDELEISGKKPSAIVNAEDIEVLDHKIDIIKDQIHDVNWKFEEHIDDFSKAKAEFETAAESVTNSLGKLRDETKSVSTHLEKFDGAETINDAVSVTDDEISVAKDGKQRRISGVAEAKAENDAINLVQFRRTLQSSNAQTLQEANNYTDQKVGALQKEVHEMDRSFRKGIASAAALHMVTPYAPGRVAVNGGTAVYRGQAAGAVGVSYWNTKGNVNFNGGVSTAGGDSTIVRAGMGYLF